MGPFAGLKEATMSFTREYSCSASEKAWRFTSASACFIYMFATTSSKSTSWNAPIISFSVFWQAVSANNRFTTGTTHYSFSRPSFHTGIVFAAAAQRWNETESILLSIQTMNVKNTQRTSCPIDNRGHSPSYVSYFILRYHIVLQLSYELDSPMVCALFSTPVVQ